MRYDVSWGKISKNDRLSPEILFSIIKRIEHRLPQTKNAEISVRAVGLSKIRELHGRYLGTEIATDVLSFSAKEGPAFVSEPGENYLGDIVVCPSFIRSSAEKRKIAYREELVRMFVHGTLHLLGFDHRAEKEAQKMFALQEIIVGAR